MDLFSLDADREGLRFQGGRVDAGAVTKVECPEVAITDDRAVAYLPQAERLAHVRAVVVQGVVLPSGEEHGDLPIAYAKSLPSSFGDLAHASHGDRVEERRELLARLLPLHIEGRKPDTYRDDVAELLAWVGLKHRMQAMPATLAGGERQRLAIARAVVNRPEILLADEPTGNVDPDMALRILKLFVELNRLGATVLFATHDEDLVARSGMPVLHLEHGRLVAQGARR